MHITVCFKTLADYQMLNEDDWQDNQGGSVDLQWARQMHNCYDESALELALRLRDELPEGTASTVSAVTIDDSRADLFLRGLLAVGYDDAVRVENGDLDLRFNPLAVSLLLASYVQRAGGQQLLLLGSQGGAGENRRTGFLLAERLGWPCIHDVLDVAVDTAPGFLRVTSGRYGAVLVQTVQLPILLVIGNVIRSPYLRVATLKQKLARNKKSVTLLAQADLLDDPRHAENDQSLIGLSRQRQVRPCRFLEGETAREKASSLYHRYLVGRLPE